MFTQHLLSVSKRFSSVLFRFYVLGVALLVLLLAGSFLTPVHAAPSRSNESGIPDSNIEASPVFFIGTAGLALSDVDFSDSRIAAGLANVGVANALNRSSHYLTCPVEGWMQLVAAGDVIDDYGRSLSARYPAACMPVTVTQLHTNVDAPGPARVNNFELRTQTVAWPTNRVFPANTVGIGEGAAVALADKHGAVPLWYARPRNLEDLTEIIRAAEGSVLLDLGSLTAEKGSDSHNLQKALINDRLGAALDLFTSVGRETAQGVRRRLVVASLGDAWRSTQLQFFATDSFVTTKGTSLPFTADSLGKRAGVSDLFAGPGVIRSETTRADGFVTIANTRDTMLQANPALQLLPAESLKDAVGQARVFEDHALLARLTLPLWYTVYGLVVAVGVIAFIVHFLRRPAAPNYRGRAVKTVRKVDDFPVRDWSGPTFIWRNLAWFNTFAFALIPAALVQNFIPWWRLPLTDSVVLAHLVALGLTVFLAVFLTVAARSTVFPIPVLAFVALLVLAGDIVAGSEHQRNGFMGSLVLTSRRFYGISNRTYLILVVAGLLMVLPWVARWLGTRFAALGVVAAGLFVLAVDAVPQWGADFGGPPGIVAGFGVAALLVAGVRLRWWHGLVWLVVSASAMGFAGWLDAASGGSESSHIGKFWASLGSPESFALIAGKIRDVLRSFTGRLSVTLTIVAVLVLGLLVVLVLRRLQQTHGVHREVLLDAVSTPGFLPVVVGIAVGVAVAVPINDSGALMLKEGIVMALPALAALMADRLVALRSSDFPEGVSPS